MGYSTSENQSSASTMQDQLKVARAIFEPQLLPLSLTNGQIETQSLVELEQSLERVNDALLHPESFGTLKIGFSGAGNVFITKMTSEAIYEIGIVPILLEKKKLILDRKKFLIGEQKIESLIDLIQNVADENVRTKLTNEIEDLKKESAGLAQQSKEVEKERLKENADVQEKIARYNMEIYERRAKVMQSFLEKESVATIVGSFLLVMITIAQLVAMFRHIAPTPIINDSFLLILGYFFGQTVSKASK
jgi:hypothetical protein